MTSNARPGAGAARAALENIESVYECMLAADDSSASRDHDYDIDHFATIRAFIAAPEGRKHIQLAHAVLMYLPGIDHPGPCEEAGDMREDASPKRNCTCWVDSAVGLAHQIVRDEEKS